MADTPHQHTRPASRTSMLSFLEGGERERAGRGRRERERPPLPGAERGRGRERINVSPLLPITSIRNKSLRCLTVVYHCPPGVVAFNDTSSGEEEDDCTSSVISSGRSCGGGRSSHEEKYHSPIRFRIYIRVDVKAWPHNTRLIPQEEKLPR